MAEPDRRRRRPTVRRKIRCNREAPCANCIKSGNEECTYESHSTPIVRQRSTRRGEPDTVGDPSHDMSTLPVQSRHGPSSLAGISSSTTNSASVPSVWEMESMRTKIRRLEEQLARATPISAQATSTTPKPNVETTKSTLAGTFHLHHEGGASGQPQDITRGITHKTRSFGQSHWINMLSQFRDIIDVIEPLIRQENCKVYPTLQKCKSLARTIKSSRTPPWPTVPTTDLPSKGVADELVDRYLQTLETVYRILHVPSFKRDYESIWVSETKPNLAFVVQVKLVLAIGACTYDDRFSLRASAIRWIYEAQTWVCEPSFKARLDIQFLQTNLLLLFARELVNVAGDSVWVSAGEVYRRAITMGLHRDPSRLPNRSVFSSEMHRRLWNTLLELALQSSLTSGGLPLISLDDFDTQPPGNFDDDQLIADEPVPKKESEFTQMSCAIALRQTFPHRLAVTKFLNDINSCGTYEETLRLDSNLRASHRVLAKSLQKCKAGTGPLSSNFDRSFVDLIMHRYLFALHLPFVGPTLRDSTYAFSRKVVTERAVRIWCAVYPPSSAHLPVAHANVSSPLRNDLRRLSTCSSGFFRSVAFQAAKYTHSELRMQLDEDDGLGPSFLRPDLLAIAADTAAWSLQCLEAGETNVKGHLFAVMTYAQLEARRRGVAEDEMPQTLVQAAEGAAEVSLQVLERMYASIRDRETAVLQPMALNTPSEVDWDFMMADSIFDANNMEQINWIMSDEAFGELPDSVQFHDTWHALPEYYLQAAVPHKINQTHERSPDLAAKAEIMCVANILSECETCGEVQLQNVEACDQAPNCVPSSTPSSWMGSVDGVSVKSYVRLGRCPLCEARLGPDPKINELRQEVKRSPAALSILSRPSQSSDPYGSEQHRVPLDQVLVIVIPKVCGQTSCDQQTRITQSAMAPIRIRARQSENSDEPEIDFGPWGQFGRLPSMEQLLLQCMKADDKADD
ncbi:uncharacterized protein JN550_009876 [Neoarthrinium moseri]|uniref:uncharacterized protein n=1 Tax=Neoarthrinium moseri TaxID=1658444 RepID=UPI001FDE8293|nr:uncharacterized protein JN550_009876 [Neoarthrinium moseri]KAI1863140.1 hypothetical protein JN550_009876 [Neoarthrinium moseri]